MQPRIVLFNCYILRYFCQYITNRFTSPVKWGSSKTCFLAILVTSVSIFSKSLILYLEYFCPNIPLNKGFTRTKIFITFVSKLRVRDLPAACRILFISSSSAGKIFFIFSNILFEHIQSTWFYWNKI